MEYWRRLNYLKLNQGLVNSTSHSVTTSGVLKSPTSIGEDSYTYNSKVGMAISIISTPRQQRIPPSLRASLPASS